MKLLAILFYIFAPQCRALDTGNNLFLTESGLSRVKTEAAKAATANTLANVLNGGGYAPTSEEFLIPLGVNSSWTAPEDFAAIPVGPVSPDPDPGSVTPHSCDEFGNCNDKPPSSGDANVTWTHYFNNYLVGYGSGCDGLTGDTQAGSCEGVLTGCQTVTEWMTFSTWWFKPYTCSCKDADVGPGHTYATYQDCLNAFGPDKETRYRTVKYCRCANPYQTPTSATMPSSPPPAPASPAGSFQPPTFPSGLASANESYVTNINNALTVIQSTTTWPPCDSSLGYVCSGQLQILLDGLHALTSTLYLVGGEFQYAPSRCSTCTGSVPVSPSTSSVSNVWVNNGQLHVFVDNQSSTMTVNGTVGLSDGAELSLSTVTAYVSTGTFAGVYADFVEHRSTNALYAMIGNLSGFVTPASSETFNTNFCISTVMFGDHCIDVNSDGTFDAFMTLCHWSVIVSALIAAYFIIHA